jgi:hypothetical protein
MRRLLAAALGAVVVAGSISATASAATVEGIPHLDHVFTIVLENENLAATWNTPKTYLNGLLAQGTFASQYYASSHVSADNYIAMTSAQTPTPLFNSDCLVSWGSCEQWEAARPDGGVSIVDQVLAAHETWKAYMDGMQVNGVPTSCVHGPASGGDPYQSGYATRHDPFVYYPPVLANDCAHHVVPYGQLAGDLASLATTPNYAFISPDTCHDGHDSPCTGADIGEPGWQKGGLVSANDWMSTEVPKLLGSPAFTTPGVASVLFITTDEAANTDATGCTTGPIVDGGGTPGTCASGIPGVGVDGGGLVGLLAIGSPTAHVPAGTTTAVPYDHVSLVRTTEDGLGLPSLTASSPSQVFFQDSAGHLNNAASPLEHSMATLFTP